MVNTLCSCGEWNDYLDEYKTYKRGYNLHCRNCGAIIFDYKKARKKDKETETKND